MAITYDPTLVMLAMFVAITGAITGLTLTAGFDQRYGRNAALALIKGAIVIGGSIWATHFVAMLAVRFPVAVGYNFVETMVSLYAAIIAAGLALVIARGQYLGPLSCVTGGILMGGAISGMHYIGMMAIRGCGVEQSADGIIISVTTAVVASMVALWFAFRRRGIAETLVSALVLGVAIPAAHFTAMGATVFTHVRAQPHPALPLLTEEMLSFMVALAALAICGLFLFLFARLTMSGLEDQQLTSLPVYHGKPFDTFR